MQVIKHGLFFIKPENEHPADLPADAAHEQEQKQLILRAKDHAKNRIDELARLKREALANKHGLEKKKRKESYKVYFTRTCAAYLRRCHVRVVGI